MLSNFIFVSQQVGILFVLIAMGAICNRSRLVPKEAIAGMTAILLTLVTPCLLVKAFQRDFDLPTLRAFGLSFLFAASFNVIGMLLAHTFVRDADSSRRAVSRFAIVFSNAGFMAIPLNAAILGDDGIFFGASAVVSFQVFAWTYGLWMMRGSADSGEGNRVLRFLKILINPGIFGTIIGFLLFVGGIHLPPLLAEPISYMAALNTPLAMLIVGWHLANTAMRPLLCDAGMWRGIALRLIAVPMALLALMFLMARSGLLDNSTLAVASTISASAPVAALTSIFATRYNRAPALAAGFVSFSTILSIITMPIIVALAMRLI